MPAVFVGPQNCARAPTAEEVEASSMWTTCVVAADSRSPIGASRSATTASSRSEQVIEVLGPLVVERLGGSGGRYGAGLEAGGLPAGGRTGVSAGWLVSPIGLGGGNDRLQRSQMPVQGDAPRFGQRYLPTRPRVRSDTGNLDIAGFNKCCEMLAQNRVGDRQAVAYVGERQRLDGREHGAYLQPQRRVDQLVETGSARHGQAQTDRRR